MGEVGCVYLNFGLWAISLVPAWLVIKEIGTKYSKARREHEGLSILRCAGGTNRSVGIGSEGTNGETGSDVGR